MAILALAEGPVLRAILVETHKIWSEGLTPLAYERYWAAQIATPWGRRGLRRYALMDGETALASAKLYTFDAMLDGNPVRVAGLGAVFTQPEFRGRGAARDLIEGLLEKATADGADLALLFSEIGANYYERLGFTTIPANLHTLRVTESDRHGAPATLVRSGDDRDLDAIAAIDATRAPAYRFHLTRDRDLIYYAIAKKRLLAGLGPLGARQVEFFVAEEGATAVAYVLLTRKRDGSTNEWTLEEYGDRDPSGARVGAILQSLIARDPVEARLPLRTWLPHGFCPPQVRVVEAHPSTDVMMMRALTARAKTASALSGEDVLYWHSDHF
jgi:predicted N-acetyltransferase YhbS